MSHPARSVTAEELFQHPDSKYYELVRGVPRVCEPPGGVHGRHRLGPDRLPVRHARLRGHPVSDDLRPTRTPGLLGGDGGWGDGGPAGSTSPPQGTKVPGRNQFGGLGIKRSQPNIPGHIRAAMHARHIAR